jgi:hypothetical protein
MAAVVFLCLVAGLGAMAPNQGFYSAAETHQAIHDDGSSCPDSEHGGKPCGPLCPCTCCFGHGVLPPFLVPEPLGVLGQIPQVHELSAPRPRELCPGEKLPGLFRPPRA